MRSTDILIENYRPGVMEALGLGYDALARLQPRLIYASISGYGQTGPDRARGGFDLIAQGVAGIMSVTGEPGGPPVKAGVPVTDLAAGLFALVGILAALRASSSHRRWPAHRHFARRRRRRIVGVGGDGIFFGHRRAVGAGIGAPDERALSGDPLRGRLHHARRRERTAVSTAVRRARPP